jgi:hypothetical protein
MKFWQKVGASALLAGFATILTPHVASAQAAIKMDGSSTVFPIAEAAAEEFQISKRGKIRVTVGIAGTGGGFKKFRRGETDISDASRPILTAEMETCRAAGISTSRCDRVRCADRRNQPTLGQDDDPCGPAQDLGAGGAGSHQDLEAGPLAMARGADHAVRPRG